MFIWFIFFCTYKTWPIFSKIIHRFIAFENKCHSQSSFQIFQVQFCETLYYIIFPPVLIRNIIYLIFSINLSQYILLYQWKMVVGFFFLNLFCTFYDLFWFRNVSLKNVNGYLRKNSAQWKGIKCTTKISREVFNVPCLPRFLQKPLLSVVSYNKGWTKFLDVYWKKAACSSFQLLGYPGRPASSQKPAGKI